MQIPIIPPIPRYLTAEVLLYASQILDRMRFYITICSLANLSFDKNILENELEKISAYMLYNKNYCESLLQNDEYSYSTNFDTSKCSVTAVDDTENICQVISLGIRYWIVLLLSRNMLSLLYFFNFLSSFKDST